MLWAVGGLTRSIGIRLIASLATVFAMRMTLHPCGKRETKEKSVSQSAPKMICKESASPPLFFYCRRPPELVVDCSLRPVVHGAYEPFVLRSKLRCVQFPRATGTYDGECGAGPIQEGCDTQTEACHSVVLPETLAWVAPTGSNPRRCCSSRRRLCLPATVFSYGRGLMLGEMNARASVALDCSRAFVG